MNESWERKFILLAKHISIWSKDPSKKIGAVAVGSKNQILSTGYNGFPRGIDDSPERLNNRTEKYKYVVHAEQNLIYNATYNGISLDDATVFIWGLPLCSECAKGILQVGVRTVRWAIPKSSIDKKWKDSYELTKELFFERGCDIKQLSHTGLPFRSRRDEM